MKIHKVAIIRNLPSERRLVCVSLRVYTFCGIRIGGPGSTTRLWRKVTCKNCLRTKA